MSAHSDFSVVRSKKAMDPGTKSALEEGLKLLIARNFRHPEKWFVYSNLKKYRPDMSVDVFGQKHGLLPEICEVYCNGEFVCEVLITDTPATALLKIKGGLAEVMIRRAEDEVRRKNADLERSAS